MQFPSGTEFETNKSIHLKEVDACKLQALWNEAKVNTLHW